MNQHIELSLEPEFKISCFADLVQTNLTKGYSQRHTVISFQQPMMSKHNCPCCSYTLLRHIRLGGLYWRCSHCYQEMPVSEIIVGTVVGALGEHSVPKSK